MSVIRKLGLLTRGTTREAAQVVVDKNVHRIMDQEIVEIESTIVAYKSTLAELIVSKKEISKESESVKKVVEKREVQAKSLIAENIGKELVDDIVKEIANQECHLESLAQARTDIEKKILKLEGILNKAILDLSNYKRELRVARAQIHPRRGVLNPPSLPRQFSELKEIHQRLMELQSLSESRDQAWSEMELRLGSGNIDARLETMEQGEQQLRAKKIFERLKAD